MKRTGHRASKMQLRLINALRAEWLQTLMALQVRKPTTGEQLEAKRELEAKKKSLEAKQQETVREIAVTFGLSPDKTYSIDFENGEILEPNA